MTGGEHGVPFEFDVNAMLCDFVMLSDRRLVVVGAGVTVFNAVTFPAVAQLSIALTVTVPPPLPAVEHSIRIVLLDADGAVQQLVVAMAGQPVVMELNAGFALNETAGEPKGVPALVPIPVNLHALPIQGPGRYEFVIEVNGVRHKRLAFTARQQAAPLRPEGLV